MVHDFGTSLLDFIHQCVPTLQAAEVILFFEARPDRAFSPEEVTAAMRPQTTVGAVTEYVTQFVEAGLITQGPDGFSYAPASPALDHAVADLRLAYDERPVTLIATIYRIADRRIQSFSDSFRLRDD